FLGTSGRMLLTKRGKLEVFDNGGQRIPVTLPNEKGVSVPRHHQNFIDAIRNGKTPNADVLTGHLSASLPHLGNIACRIGRSFDFDPTREQIVGDREANQLLGREYRDGYWAVPKR